MIHITADNFQSLQHVELTASGLTVVVGPSDRGKSALLRAIEAALFNRAGDQFVRHGAKTATVTLTFAVGPDPVHWLRWEKGSGANKFSVDGVDYSKVGTKAPKVLQDLGFKDVVIGARLTDDGKLEGGETIRPQIARQFDRIFLLDESGPFLNEVLVGLSRLGVLQRAGRLCTADLRQEKSLLKTREADLATAELQRQALAPILDVRTRLDALQARETALLPRQTRRGQIHMAWGLRRHWQARAAVTLPPVGPRALPNGEVVRQLQPLLTERTRLQRAVAVRLPPPRVIHAETVARVRGLLALAPLVSTRRQLLVQVDETTRKMAYYVAIHATSEDALQTLKTELKVCPVCQKPWG